MKLLKKFFALTMVVLMLTAFGVFTGCSKEETDQKTADNDKDKMELTFYYPVNVGGSASEIIDNLCVEFNKLHPDIEVKPVYTGNYDDTVTKIQTAVQGGNPPDFFINLATQRFTMVDTNIATPLQSLVDNDPDGQAYIDDFLEGFMSDAYVDGELYSIPFQRSTMILFYNKDAFKEVGLDPEKPPKDWDELEEYAAKLTKDGRYGVGLALNSGSAQWSMSSFTPQNSANGEDLMTPDGKKVLFNTPENVEVLKFWKGLQDKGYMQPGIVQWTDLPTQFLSGQVAMIYHTTGNLKNIDDNAEFEYGTAFLPQNKRAACAIGGGNFYISQGISDERKQAAWEFIKFATSTENAADWALKTGYVPVRKSCFETDEIKNYYAELPQASVAMKQLEFGHPELATYDSAEVWRILNDNIQAAIIGDLTPEEALEKAQEDATEILKEYN